MDPIYEIELQDCPYCRGTGTVEDEQGWCVYVTCVDCGAQTAHASYESPEELLAAAQQVAHLWNVGKVLNPGVGDCFDWNCIKRTEEKHLPSFLRSTAV